MKKVLPKAEPMKKETEIQNIKRQIEELKKQIADLQSQRNTQTLPYIPVWPVQPSTPSTNLIYCGRCGAWYNPNIIHTCGYTFTNNPFNKIY